MRSFLLALPLAAAIILAACSEEDAGMPPPPLTLAADATGHYCGMLLSEHTGPKGQILLGSGKPVWFTSVRDTFTFLQLPEEPKDVAGIYVSDMGAAPSWENPGDDNWIAAADALYVIESDRAGGMGGAEAVPFGKQDAAAAFVAAHGGKIVDFAAAQSAVATGAADSASQP